MNRGDRTRAVVFFVHVWGWTPHAGDLWRGPYKTVSAAQGQATRMTRNADGSVYGDWGATIYRLDHGTLTLVAV